MFLDTSVQPVRCCVFGCFRWMALSSYASVYPLESHLFGFGFFLADSGACVGGLSPPERADQSAGSRTILGCSNLSSSSSSFLLLLLTGENPSIKSGQIGSCLSGDDSDKGRKK